MISIELDLGSAPRCLRMAGTLTIAACATARGDLLQLFTTLPAGPLAWDLSALEEIDGAGVQLLLSAQRTLAERGHAVQVHGCTDVVQGVAAALGAADADTAFGAPRAAQVELA